MPERATTCTTSQDLISTPRRRDENETPTNNILAIIFLQYISLSRLLQFKSKSGIQYEARPPRRKKNKKTLRHQCTNKYISQETIKKSIILALYSTIFFSQKISSFPMKNIFQYSDNVVFLGFLSGKHAEPSDLLNSNCDCYACTNHSKVIRIAF